MKKGTTLLKDVSGLKIPGICTQEALNEIEYKHFMDASYSYLIAKKKMKKMTRETLNKLHRDIFGKIWKWAGKKRTSDANLGVKHFHIDEQFQNFFKDLQVWESHKMDPVEMAVRIHHRLVQIHPYPNGNGRWARLVANVFLCEKIKKIFLWPELEIRKESAFRKKYLRALKDADFLDYSLLLKMHQEILAPLP